MRFQFIFEKKFYKLKMGISASYQPTYPGYKDFVLFIENADRVISNDKYVWSLSEKIVLHNFFDNLKKTLQNSEDYNSQLPWGSPGIYWSKSNQLEDYFNFTRSIIPRSKHISKLYNSAHNCDFNQLQPNTKKQIAQVYGLIIFLWLIFHDGHNPSKYFYKTDILHYIYDNNTNSIETMLTILRKIYFTNKDGHIPPHSLIIPTSSFRLIDGKLCSDYSVINGPKTYNVVPDPEIINEPFYTLSPVQIGILLKILPLRSDHKITNLDQIQEDINVIISHLKNKTI
jgi:hypothetical protein